MCSYLCRTVLPNLVSLTLRSCKLEGRGPQLLAQLVHGAAASLTHLDLGGVNVDDLDVALLAPATSLCSLALTGGTLECMWCPDFAWIHVQVLG